MAAVLCLASRQTTASVRAACEQMSILHANRHRQPVVVAVTTVAEAKQCFEARPHGPWLAVVAALGTQPADLIFDRAQGPGSSLMDAVVATATAATPAPLMVVYSHTAKRTPAYQRACMAAGADVVLNSSSALVTELRRHLGQLPEQHPTTMHLAEHAARLQFEGSSALARQVLAYHSTLTKQIAKLPHPLTTRRRARRRASGGGGGGSGGTVAAGAETGVAARNISNVPLPVPVSVSGTSATATATARFVVVSDTHTMHDRLHLPEGDVLLHCGDFLGNYGSKRHELEDQLADFALWLSDAAEKYQAVVFVAGNHDTLLDTARYPQHRQLKARFLAGLPSNVHYLEHSGVEITVTTTQQYQDQDQPRQPQTTGTHMDVTPDSSGAASRAAFSAPLATVPTNSPVTSTFRVWGSPMTLCRREKFNKRFYSNAFETVTAQRRALWEAVPEGTDVLLTHVPARGKLCGRIGVGDATLTSRLASMRLPPRIHCCGHVHGSFGVRHGAAGMTTTSPATTHINAAQEHLLGELGHGCGLVFDLQQQHHQQQQHVL
eukprot:m.16736 g.16736  ORF g.16736 m.16736 type:complete len:550 (-) comp5323_c0_seq1:132-1781(-)